MKLHREFIRAIITADQPTDKTPMDWTDAIKNRLEERDLNIEDAAKMIGVARSTMGNYLNKLREPSIEQILTLFAKLDIPASTLDADPIPNDAHPSIRTNFARRAAPVLTCVKENDRGHMEEVKLTALERGTLEFPTRDREAFGVLVANDSMHPRFMHGEYAMIEPNEPFEPGDCVYVRLKAGAVFIRVLAWRRGGSVQLTALNQDRPPLTLRDSDIALICPAQPVHRRYFRPMTWGGSKHGSS